MRSVRTSDAVDMLGGAKALMLRRGCVAKHPRKQPGCRVDDYGCAELSTRENIIANGQLLVCDQLGNALVYTFIATAEKHDSLHPGQFASLFLIESGPLGRK
jgi:hypothetical protein